nr:hypothetical protein [Actinomycetota bacterium]
VVRVEPEPGRRHGRRSETTAHVAAVAEATEHLALRQRQLEAQMATLERISDATVKSVARASSEAAALAPVRSELKAVRDELWEHDQALARLARSVENLRRKVPAPAPAPAAKKAPAATSATPAKAATRKPKKQ